MQIKINSTFPEDQYKIYQKILYIYIIFIYLGTYIYFRNIKHDRNKKLRSSMIIIFVVDTLSRVSLLKVPLENEGGTDIEVSLLCHKKHRRK